MLNCASTFELFDGRCGTDLTTRLQAILRTHVESIRFDIFRELADYLMDSLVKIAERVESDLRKDLVPLSRKVGFLIFLFQFLDLSFFPFDLFLFTLSLLSINSLPYEF